MCVFYFFVSKHITFFQVVDRQTTAPVCITITVLEMMYVTSESQSMQELFIRRLHYCTTGTGM